MTGITFIFLFIQDICHSNLLCHYHNTVRATVQCDTRHDSSARRFMRIKNIKYHFIMLLKVFHIRQQENDNNKR